MRLRRPVFLTLLFVLVLTGLALPALHAQDVPVLSLAVPQFVNELFTPELLAEFEQANGVKVNVVIGGQGFFGSSSGDLEGYLDEMTAYVNSADVVYTSSNNLTVEATRAGLFLDLAPLTSADASLYPEDFFPAIWQSVQWDGSVWAIPVSADVTLLVYDPAAFDNAGMSYPNENWTIDDLANAARALTEYDTSGAVTTPGLITFGGNFNALLMRSLLGEGFYDTSVLPNAPRFTNPALESLLTTWVQLQSEGVISSSFSGQLDEVPMRLTGNFGFGRFNANTQEPGLSLLPGGGAGLDVQSFAVSSGTRYPEAAYALAKFLSLSPEVSSNFLGATPARQSLVGVDVSQPTGPGGGGPGGGGLFRGGAQNQAALDLGLPNALPTSELRFGDYLSVALQKMTDEGLDAHAALQEAELAAVTNLQIADNHKTTTVLAVATPVPTPVLAAGEISLTFGYSSFVQPLPNQADWDRVIEEFVAYDPQVRQINLETENQAAADYATLTDCWYLPYNYVPEADLSTILNLDPYMDADTSFDKSDVMGGVLSQLQRDNKTWAMPVVLQPQSLNYDSIQFAQALVPEPVGGWTTDQFNAALPPLKTNMVEGEAPFASRSAGSTYLLMLIASYGGIPLDYRTTPPTVNFTDATNSDAIRQVLNLAKDGYIDYQELGGGGAVIIFGAGDDSNEPPIYTSSLGGFFFRRGGGRIGDQTQEDSAYKLTTYPLGSQFASATYDLGTAYISATTANADACYRWISTLARHPELFSGMPARQSLLSDSTVLATQTPDETAFYQAFSTLLNDPNTVAFPTAFAGSNPANFLLQLWLQRAFDHYVLEDADLEAELTDAQTYASSFLQCTANIPAYEPASGDQQSYLVQYVTCATTVDSSLTSLFPQLSQ